MSYDPPQMARGGRALWLAALLAAMVWVPSARAYVVTLGPSELPSTPPDEGFICEDHCEAPFTIAQRSSSYPYAAPASGVITSWRVTAEEGSSLELRVLEPSPGGDWVGAGTSTAATNLAGGPNATELAIGQGGLIGADVGLGSLLGGNTTAPAGDEILEWQPLLGEGGSGRAGEPFTGKLLMLNAEVELTPVVTSVSPASGSTAGGDTVTIAGKYLDSALNVVFGSRPATTFSVDLTGESITATAPASTAGTVDVHVSNLHSTSETVAADSYTFVAPTTPPTGPPPPSGTGAGGQSATGTGTPTPVVSGFGESTGRWRLGSSLPHISSVPLGTRFSFSLNEPASVGLTFMRVLPGRRVSGKCLASRHQNRSRPKCKRNVSAGSLAVPGHAGLNTIRFQGRLSSAKKLTPGNYTVAVTTRDSLGLRTLTRSLSFAVVP